MIEIFNILSRNPFFQRIPSIFGYIVIIVTLYWFIHLLRSRELGLTKSEIITLILIIAGSLALNLQKPYMTGAGGGEEYNYILIGEEISHTGRFVVSRMENSDLYLKPYIIYPVLVSIPSFFMETTRNLGVTVNTVTAGFLLFAIFLAVRKIGNSTAAFTAVIIGMFNPFFIHMARTPESMISAATFFFLTAFTLHGFLEKRNSFWAKGLSVCLTGLIFSRTGMWILLPLLIWILYREDIDIKKYVLETVFFFTMVSVVFLMNIIFTLNMDRAFGGNPLISNSLALVNFFQNSLGYIPLIVLTIPAMIYGVKQKKQLFLYIGGLLHFFFFLSYRHATITDHPKFYLTSFLVFISAVSIMVSEFNTNRIKGKILPVLTILIVVLPMANHIPDLQKDMYYTPAKITLGISTRLHPGCTIIPRDVRPVRLAGFENAVDPWKFHKENLGELETVRKINDNCIIYYKPFEETPDHLKYFEENFDMEKITGFRYESREIETYLVNIDQ